jgi:hypothetical protein
LEITVRAAEILNTDKGLGATVDKKAGPIHGVAEKDGALHIADFFTDRVREVALHLEDGVGTELGLSHDGAVAEAGFIT